MKKNETQRENQQTLQCQKYLRVNLEQEFSHKSLTAMMEPHLYLQFLFHPCHPYKAKLILGMLAPNKEKHKNLRTIITSNNKNYRNEGCPIPCSLKSHDTQVVMS